MKSFAQYITEIFEKPYPIQDTGKSAVAGAAAFKQYKVRTKGGDLVVEVARVSSDAWSIDFTVNDSYELTDSGEATKILSTVFEAMRQFCTEYEEWAGELPVEFQMKANKAEGNRTRVYKALVRRFGGEFGYKVKEVREWNPFPGMRDGVKFDIIVVRRD